VLLGGCFTLRQNSRELFNNGHQLSRVLLVCCSFGEFALPVPGCARSEQGAVGSNELARSAGVYHYVLEGAST
jgi:hypothetical protein